jgi:hypothetical protein
MFGVYFGRFERRADHDITNTQPVLRRFIGDPLGGEYRFTVSMDRVFVNEQVVTVA